MFWYGALSLIIALALIAYIVIVGVIAFFDGEPWGH